MEFPVSALQSPSLRIFPLRALLRERDTRDLSYQCDGVGEEIKARTEGIPGAVELLLVRGWLETWSGGLFSCAPTPLLSSSIR